MDKAQAAKFYLVSKFGPDWRSKVRVVYAGDDVADEEAMKALKEDALTFRVTDDSETLIKFRLVVEGPYSGDFNRGSRLF